MKGSDCRVLDLLSKGEQRELAVFKMLYNSDEWLTLDEIARELEMSVVTAKKSVTNLSLFSAETDDAFTIELKKTKGVFLYSSDHFSSQQLLSMYMKETTSFKLLDKIFQQNQLTIRQLINELYLSKSTVYRTIRRLNEVLGKSELKINTNTLMIDGDELLIREFCYQFYWGMVEDGHWPFRGISEDVTYQQIRKTMSLENIHFSHLEILQVMYRLAVNFIRHAKKCYIVSFEKNYYIDPFREKYIQVIPKDILGRVPTKYLEYEMNYLRLIIVSFPFLDERTLKYADINEWNRDNETTAYSLAVNVLTNLQKNYPQYAFLENEELLFRTVCIGIYSLAFAKLKVHTVEGQEQLERIQRRTPVFFKVLKTLVKTASQSQSLIHFQEEYYLQYLYASLAYALDLTKLEYVIHVRLTSVKNPLSEQQLKAGLLRRSRLNLVVYTRLNQEEEQVELLLTDVDSDYVGKDLAKRVYIWNSIPTDRDWEQIVVILSEIYEEKMKEIAAIS